MVPISEETFSDQDILELANEEIDLEMAPAVLKVREEFYVTPITVPILPNIYKYEIPYRAMGSQVRLLQIVVGNQVYPISRIEPEQNTFFNTSSYVDTSVFWLENNSVVFASPFTNASKIIFHIYLKPNDLVDTRRVGVISGIDTVNGIININNLSFPANLTAGSLCDLLQARPNHKTYTFDVPIVSVNPTTKQIFLGPGNIPTGLMIGDNIASAGECMIPQIPSELHPMLAQTVACRILEALGDTKNLQLANNKLADMEKKLLAMIGTRTPGNIQKINNLGGLIRRGRRFYGFGRY